MPRENWFGRTTRNAPEFDFSICPVTHASSWQGGSKNIHRKPDARLQHAPGSNSTPLAKRPKKLLTAEDAENYPSTQRKPRRHFCIVLKKQFSIFQKPAFFVFFRKQRLTGIFPGNTQIGIVPQNSALQLRKIKFIGLVDHVGAL